MFVGREVCILIRTTKFIIIVNLRVSEDRGYLLGVLTKEILLFGGQNWGGGGGGGSLIFVNLHPATSQSFFKTRTCKT